MNTKRVTFRLDPDLREALEDAKWKEKTSMNDLVNRILREYFERKIHENKS